MSELGCVKDSRVKELERLFRLITKWMEEEGGCIVPWQADAAVRQTIAVLLDRPSTNKTIINHQNGRKLAIMNVRLPFDYCRCHDSSCPVKEQCLRWLERETGNERTPHAMSLRSVDEVNCVSKIENELLVWPDNPCKPANTESQENEK